ncbi:MAG: hypothetical protein ACRCXZ_02445, partial [Patescibacteria group bacterium]
WLTTFIWKLSRSKDSITSEIINKYNEMIVSLYEKKTHNMLNQQLKQSDEYIDDLDESTFGEVKTELEGELVESTSL